MDSDSPPRLPLVKLYKILAEVPGVARESSILIYLYKKPIGLENV
jgi:hypothetical protein